MMKKLFEYLRWKAEFNAKRRDEAKIEKERLKEVELVGEIEGLKLQIETWTRASHTLYFSPHAEIGKLQMTLAKKIALREYLKKKREAEERI